MKKQVQHVEMPLVLFKFFQKMLKQLKTQKYQQAIETGLEVEKLLLNDIEHYKLNPEEVDYDYKVIGSIFYIKITDIYIDLNNPHKAIVYLVKAIKLEQQVKEQNKASIQRIAGAYARIGKACFYACNYDLSRHFLQLAEKSLNENNLQQSAEMGLTQAQLGNYYRFMFKDEEALKALELSLEIRINLFGHDSIEVAESYHGLAQLESDTDQINKAHISIDKAIEIYEKILGRKHIKTAKSIYLKGNLYLRVQPNSNSLKLSEDLIIESLNINREIIGEIFLETADCYHSLGKIKSQNLNTLEYIEYFQKALYILETIYGKYHACIAILMNNLGRAHFDRRRFIQRYKNKLSYEDAVQCFQRSIIIYQKICGETHGNLAITLKSSADCHKLLGRFKEAHQQYTQSLQIYENIETDYEKTKKQIKKLLIETQTEE